LVVSLLEPGEVGPSGMVYVVSQPYATGGNQIVSRFLWVVTGGPGYKTPTDVKEAGATMTVIISTKNLGIKSI
jgi:hypothetical protein